MTEHWYPAYIGLGSNLNNPILQLETAFVLLSEIPLTRLVRQSSLYRSEPFGGIEQPDFVNAVAALITQLPAAELLLELQSIENKCGRKRTDIKWGPRSLDLDLLVYSDHEINETNLVKHLYTKNIPDPELLIRTGNTNRLSNFLLWQLAYAEIFFVKKLWPDFKESDYIKILGKFTKIKRNFGKI